MEAAKKRPTIMPENYYDDEPAGGKPEDKSSKSETFLLPKAVLRGSEFEAGETITLKLVADHGEEIEVAPTMAETEKEDENETEPEEPEAPEAPEEAPAGMGPMSGMME